MAVLRWELLATPIGTLLIAGTASELHAVEMLDEDLPRDTLLPPVLEGWPRRLRRLELVRGSVMGGTARAQIEAYFTGARLGFDLPLAFHGTPYQERVWQELRRIPYGETRSYGQIAARLGRTSPRAVGMANHRNHLPIVIPCHRVVGADGSLVGFGGGLARKRWLLDHEAGQKRLR